MEQKAMNYIDKLRLILGAIRKQSGAELIRRDCLERGISEFDFDRIINRLLCEGRIYEPKPGRYKIA